MNIDERILDALARWSDARSKDEPVNAEDLCRDFPEILDELRRRIRMLEAMEWLDSHNSSGTEPSMGNESPLSGSGDSASEPTSQQGLPAPKPRIGVGSLVRYFGDYELVAEIARGGMGVVFKARQVRLKRIVAVKMILAGRLASAEDVRRFHIEAEAAANLDHPHIVPVFEVGEHQGLHYFSMGYVDGISLATQLRESPLPPREAATMLKSVANAIQYAHRLGVIHRDLKPGNILIDKQGQPRVTDFGLAKLTTPGSNEMTGTGQILGTPSYMPPEQAVGNTNFVREPADIYALGAVLYAMLTGRPPFQTDNPVSTLRMVLEQDPVPPRQLNPAVPQDLETICLKCLEKAASRRYASAEDLAKELGRFLEGKPIMARRIGMLERGRKWCGRNRMVASLIGVIALSLLLGTIVSTYFALEADHRADENFALAKKEAEARVLADEQTVEAKTQKRLAFGESANLAMNEARSFCDRGEANIGLHWMARAHGLAIEATDLDLADACRASISGWLSHVPHLERHLPKLPYGNLARYGEGESTIVVGEIYRPLSPDDPAALLVLDAESFEEQYRQENVQLIGINMALSADRTKVFLRKEEGKYQVWSLPQKSWLGAEIRPKGPLHCAAFSPHDELLATATGDGQVEFWNATTGAPTGIQFHQSQVGRSSDVPFFAMCFDPAKRTLFSAGQEGKLLQTDVNTGMAVHPPIELPQTCFAMEASPDGSRLALGLFGETEIRSTGEKTPQLGAAHLTENARGYAFSPDSRILAETGAENRIVFRDARTAAQLGSSATVSSTGVQLDFNGQGDAILASMQNYVSIWRLPEMIHDRDRRVHTPTTGTSFQIPESLKALRRGAEGGVVQVPPTAEATLLPVGTNVLTSTPDRKGFVFTTLSGGVGLANFDTGSLVIATEQHLPTPMYIAHAPDSSVCLTLNEETVRLWKLPVMKPLGGPLAIPATLRDVSFGGPENRLVGLHDRLRNQFHILDLKTGDPVSLPLELGRGSSNPLLLKDDDRFTVVRFSALELWRRSTGKLVKRIGKHDSTIFTQALSPDQRFVATAGNDSVLRIWDMETGSAVGRPIRGIEKEVILAFSPEGRFIASQPFTLPARIWHVRTGREIAPPFKYSNFSYKTSRFKNRREGFHLFSFSTDGRLFLDHTGSGAHVFLPVPEEHERLVRFVETTTGLTLDDNDVRVLSRDEWTERQKQRD